MTEIDEARKKHQDLPERFERERKEMEKRSKEPEELRRPQDTINQTQDATDQCPFDELDLLKPLRDSVLWIHMRFLGKVRKAQTNVVHQQTVDEGSEAAHGANVALSCNAIRKTRKARIFEDTFVWLYGMRIRDWEDRTKDFRRIKESINMRGEVQLALLRECVRREETTCSANLIATVDLLIAQIAYMDRHAIMQHQDSISKMYAQLGI